MAKRKGEQKAVHKDTVPLAGLESFPLEKLGLTVESIESSNRHILIPRELLPYLKLCKTTVTQREKGAIRHDRFLLRLKAKKLEELRRKARGR